MKIVGSTTAAVTSVLPRTGGSFTGLATGMFIEPCIVFPAGATITDLQVAATEAFTASVAAAQESYLYSFSIREATVATLGLVATSSVTARVGDSDDASTTLFSVSAVSSAAATMKDLVGKRNGLGVSAVSVLNCTAHFGTSRAVGLSFASTHKLTCKAPLSKTQVVPFSFIKAHPLTAKANLKVPPTVRLSLRNSTYADPQIIWDTRFSWWAFDDETGIYPYRNPVDRTGLSRSITQPRALLTVN